MRRGLLFANVVLAGYVILLLLVEGVVDRARAAARRYDSTLVAAAGEEGPAPEAVARVEIHMPGIDEPWTCVRTDGAWRLPRRRGAYARGRQVDNLLKALLDGRGTRVGRLPRDGARYGFAVERVIRVCLEARAEGAPLEMVLAGTAPGTPPAECYLAVAGRDEVIRLHANPRAALEAARSEPVPLADRRVVPAALGHGGAQRIVLAGRAARGLTALVRHEAASPRGAPGGAPMPGFPGMTTLRGRGPEIEWRATLGGRERKLDAKAAGAYVNRLVTLEWEELLESLTPEEAAARAEGAMLRFELHGAEDAVDVLALPGGEDRRGVLINVTTGQVFRLASKTARLLLPNVEGLLPK
jgi:hypothetical protein